jgi:hypothetical protein
MTKTERTVLAEKIASALFMSGDGEKGTRLQIKLGRPGAPPSSEKTLGGWCERAVVYRIVELLDREEFEE